MLSLSAQPLQGRVRGKGKHGHSVDVDVRLVRSAHVWDQLERARVT